jgi:DNA-binding response OmpR family regulator
MRRVLIVEDNLDLLSILKDLLSRDYDVHTARTGEDAISVAAAVQPDLIILDLQLPGMHGMEAGRRIKRQRAPETVPVLALTAMAGHADARTILSCGCCDAYMAKPATLAAIKKRVLELLGSEATEVAVQEG